MCIFVSRPMKIVTFLRKNDYSQNGLLIFLGKETHSETKSWKSSRILTNKVTTTTVNPANRLLFSFFHFFIFFIFSFCPIFQFSYFFIFHVLSFSLSLLGAQNLIFLGFNFVTISLDNSYVKNQFWGPSRVVSGGTPLGTLSLFPLLFSPLFFSFFLLFLFFHFFPFFVYFRFLMFFIYFFHFFPKKKFLLFFFLVFLSNMFYC